MTLTACGLTMATRWWRQGGNRPFARFKAAADVLDLLQDWYDYQNKWYMEKAEEWMREKEVCFEDGKVVCKGTSSSTVALKARPIRQLLKLSQYWDKDFSTRHMQESNPMNMLMDLSKFFG